MASIHLTEIARILFEGGQQDALPPPEGKGGYFVEIRFDDPTKRPAVVDEEYRDQVITADCPYGMVTIQFDAFGQLKSIDVS